MRPKTCARVERRDWRPAKCRTSWIFLSLLLLLLWILLLFSMSISLLNNALWFLQLWSNFWWLITLNTLSMRITRTNRRTLPARPIIRESWDGRWPSCYEDPFCVWQCFLLCVCIQLKSWDMNGDKPWILPGEKRGSMEVLQVGRWCWGVPLHYFV